MKVHSKGAAFMKPSDTNIQGLLDKAKHGSAEDRHILIYHACGRLLKLTRKMFNSFRNLKKFEQTDDIFQNALIRLHRALNEVQVENVRHFFNLAALQIRRELLDLCKHYYGKEGIGSRHADIIDKKYLVESQIEKNNGQFHDWTRFHELIEGLPAEEQEILNLLFYEGFNQEEVADFLEISLSTVKRRWQSARLKLAELI